MIYKNLQLLTPLPLFAKVQRLQGTHKEKKKKKINADERRCYLPSTQMESIQQQRQLKNV